MSKVALTGMEFHKLMQHNEELQRVLDKENHTTQVEIDARAADNKLNLKLNENATNEEKEEFRDKTKKISKHMVGLMWHFTKGDIEATLGGVYIYI